MLLLLLLQCSADNRFNVQRATAYPHNHHHNRITITTITIIIVVIIIVIIIAIIITISFAAGAPELLYMEITVINTIITIITFIIINDKDVMLQHKNPLVWVPC